MSTKPVTLPRWATNLTNNDAPSSGQMDTGWTPNQTGVSDYDNYVKYWTYKWCEYLNDGDLTLNDLSTRDVSGRRITANQFIGSTGTALAMTADINELSLSAFASYAHLTPDVNGWTLHGMANGFANEELHIVNTDISTAYFYVKHQSVTCPTALSRFWFPESWRTPDDRIIIPPGASIRVRYVSGSGWYVVGGAGILVPRGIFINGPASQPSSINSASIYLEDGAGGGPTGASNQVWRFNSVAGNLVSPVPLRTGSIIKSYETYVFKGGATSTINSRMLRVSSSGTVVAMGAGETSGTGSSAYTLGDVDTGVAGYKLVAGENIFIRTSFPGTGADDFYGVKVVAWEPLY